MASPKLVALFFAFAVASAALQPSEAARVQVQQGFKPAAASQEAEKVADQAADGGVPRPWTPPGIPAAGQLSPQIISAILGLLFPQVGAIIGLLQPLLPPPGSLPSQGGIMGGGLPSSPPQPQPTECMMPLVGMLPCADYLTNTTVLTPPGECCDGLKSIIRDAPICLCHGMNGDMNKFLPKPVEPIRMTILPLACGTMLPIQTLFLCNSQQVPPIMPPSPAEPPMTPAGPPPVSLQMP
ncbi:hypothetical protein BS78_06G187300 [Paspalum vaginatum]|nr:hypothetical protein BS78_06G187300 [Paspalum vaginatum]